MKSQVETGRCSKDLLLRKRSFTDMTLEWAKEKKKTFQNLYFLSSYVEGKQCLCIFLICFIKYVCI